MIINHNLSAIFSYRQQKFNNLNVNKDMEKLSSTLKINTAGDDAANLAVSEKMRSNIRGAYQAERNAENGISLIQTAEGYLVETLDILHRIRELAIKSSNGINSNEEREYIQMEVNKLVDEVDRIASHAQFNGLNLLTGRFANNGKSEGVVTGSMWLHIGPRVDQREQLFIGTMTSYALKLKDIRTQEIISVETQDYANKSIGIVDYAIKKVNSQRADIGSYQNRLESALKKLLTEAENLQSAESIIRDADMASESVKLSKDIILANSSTLLVAMSNDRTKVIERLYEEAKVFNEKQFLSSPYLIV